jgi:hypothetical protein
MPPGGQWTRHGACAKVLTTEKGSNVLKNMRGVKLSGRSYTIADAAVQGWAVQGAGCVGGGKI